MTNDGGVAYCLPNMYVYLDTPNIYIHSGSSDTIAGNRRGPKPRTPAPSKSAPLKPHGKKDGARRTPKHMADPHGGKDMYTIETILVQRWVHGQKQWQVKWAGFDNEANTWEPIEHLAGCEDYIATFEKEQDQWNRALEDEHARKKQKRVEEDAAQAQASPSSVVLDEPAVNPKRSSRCWQTFSEPYKVGKDEYTKCTFKMENGTVCGTPIKYNGGTTNMLNHQEHVHKHWVTDYNAKATRASMNLKLAVDEGTGVVDLETQIRWTKERHHNACRKLAFWLAKRKRPLSIVEDEEFRDFTSAISMGKFSSTSRREMDKQMLEMGGAVLHNHREAVAQMKKTGVKPSMAADIWSDTDVSLLATTLYFIDENWAMQEWLVGCTGFAKERHNADNISAAVEKQLADVGLTYADIHAKVSDNGSNIKKAWNGLPGGFCAAHTVERSVLVYVDDNDIAPVVKKLKAMTAHLHRSHPCPYPHPYAYPNPHPHPYTYPHTYEYPHPHL